MYLFFLYLALALFFLLALTRPTHAHTLLASLLPTYLLRFTLAGIPTNFFEVSVWLTLLGFLITRYPLRITFPSPVTGYWLLVTLFIIAAIFSTLLTPTLHSFGILKSWVLTPIVFAWMVGGAAPAVAYQRRLEVINALIISGVIVSLIGLFQLGSIDRITSIYDVPNSLALFIAPLIILALFRGRPGGEPRPEGAGGCLNYLAALIMFSALLGTQSLAGLAAVLLAIFIGLLIQHRLVTGYWLLVTALLLSLTFLTFTDRLSYFLQPVFNSSVHTSLTVRQQLWGISWELIKEHPIRGIGLGQFEPAYQQKLHQHFQNYWLLVTGYQPLDEFVFRDPHNWFLSFWLNTGLLGLISFSVLNLFALKPLFPSRVTGYGLQAPALALLALLLFGLVDTIYWKNDLAALHWLLLIALYTPLRKEYTMEVR